MKIQTMAILTLLTFTNVTAQEITTVKEIKSTDMDAMSTDDRFKLRERLNIQRTEDYRNGNYERNGGVVDPVPEDVPLFVRQYHDYYKTARGYHRRSPNSNEGIIKTSSLVFINMPILSYIGEIRSAVL